VPRLRRSRLVLAEAFECRLANHAISRPAGELGADDELRADPRHAAEVATPPSAIIPGRWRIERRLLDDERLEAPQQRGSRPATEARADLAAEAEPSVLVDTDDQGTQVARVAGETAPLLFTAFGNQYWNRNPNQPTAALPLQIFTYAISPFDEWHKQAWAGALILIIMIVVAVAAVRITTSRGTLKGAS
jgi:hypothetical protein